MNTKRNLGFILPAAILLAPTILASASGHTSQARQVEVTPAGAFVRESYSALAPTAAGQVIAFIREESSVRNVMADMMSGCIDAVADAQALLERET